MPKDSAVWSDPQAMVVKTKLERLLQSQCHRHSGENSAATQHMIVHDESELKLAPGDTLLQDSYPKGDSQQEKFSQVSKIAPCMGLYLSLYMYVL